MKALKELEKKLTDLIRSRRQVHVVTVEAFRGETVEEAKLRYEKENNIKLKSYDNPYIIHVYSDQQIREQRRRNEKLR